MEGRRTAVIGLVLAAGLAVSGCTAGTTDAVSESPSPPASSEPAESPEPTPGPEVEAERSMLPIPPEEIAEWAESAVPGPDTDGYATGGSGWMSAHTSAHHTSEFRSLEPGAYQGQIACRGDGTISLSAGDVGSPTAAEPVVCTNATIAFDIATNETGMQVVLDLDGAPTIYALSVVRVS